MPRTIEPRQPTPPAAAPTIQVILVASRLEMTIIALVGAAALKAFL